MKATLCLVFLVLISAGCAANSGKQDPNHFSHISEGIKERTDYTLRQPSESGRFKMPEWVTLDDGLSQDEAVALALWNNAQFQADLAALGFARADLLEANMLKNPVFSVLFPVNPELLEATLDIPIDALWQRPHRVAVAKLDAQKLSENLIENGLGLVRDVQKAYSKLTLAQERVVLATENTQLQVRIAQINRSRLKTGDISGNALIESYVNMKQTADTAKRYSKEVEILEQRLHNLLGITSDNITFEVIPQKISSITTTSVDEMLEAAFVCRPDLRAAELEIEAAGKRIGWEKSKVYNFITVLEGDDTELEHETFIIRPGISVEIPLFNQNDAKIAQAKAELEQAARKYEALRQNIILQVRQAFTRYISDYEEYKLWNNNIIPSFQKKVEQTTQSFEIGEITYLTVFEARQRLIEAKVKLVESTAQLLIDAAELNFCIGKKLI